MGLTAKQPVPVTWAHRRQLSRRKNLRACRACPSPRPSARWAWPTGADGDGNPPERDACVEQLGAQHILDFRANDEAQLRSNGSGRQAASSEHRDAPGPSPARVRLLELPEASLDDDAVGQLVQSNNRVIPLWFLGTSAVASDADRNPATFAMRCHNEVWLFGCGEDTQRQLLKVATSGRQTSIRHLKMSRIFIPSLTAASVAGLPGMLCTLSAAKGESEEQNSLPIHLYGPEGLADFVHAMLDISDTFLVVPVICFEFTRTPPPDELREPQMLSRRAKLFQVLVPPDALNPEGATTALLSDSPLQRKRRRAPSRGRLNQDFNIARWRTPSRPPPGDPSATPPQPGSCVWTVMADSCWKVTVADSEHQSPVLAFGVHEPISSGHLLVEKCVDAKVPKGPAYGMLKRGQSVCNADGQVVHPWQVMEPDEEGLVIAVLGSHQSSALQRCVGDTAVAQVLLLQAWATEEGLGGTGTLNDGSAIESSSSVHQSTDARIARDMTRAVQASVVVLASTVVWPKHGPPRACTHAECAKLADQLEDHDVMVVAPDDLDLLLLGRADESGDNCDMNDKTALPVDGR